MRVIDPAETIFSLISGLSPAEMVDTLADVLRPKEERDPYWSDSAVGLLRRAAVLADAAGGEWWTLQNIGRIAASDEVRKEVIRAINPDHADSDAVLADALMFFAEEWAGMDSKPKSGILSVARTWISTITAHPDLLKWASALPGRDSFDLLSPLTGGRLGFLMPDYRYGRAGSVVTALLKARLYAGLKKRAERAITANETPLVLIIDEAQEVATRDDTTMLAIGRSLGLALVAATQSVEGINDKLGAAPAAKWLSIFGNAVCLVGRSPATDAFMAHRIGSVWRPSLREAPGASVRDTIASDVLSGVVATTRNQPAMARWYTPNLLPVGFRKRQRGVMAALNEADRSPISVLTPSALIHADEFTTLLAEPNLALALITRARVPRRDVIKLNVRF